MSMVVFSIQSVCPLCFGIMICYPVKYVAKQYLQQPELELRCIKTLEYPCVPSTLNTRICYLPEGAQKALFIHV